MNTHFKHQLLKDSNQFSEINRHEVNNLKVEQENLISSPKSDKLTIKKKAIFKIYKIKKINNWTDDEDQRLRDIVENLGKKNWKNVADFFQGKSQIQCSSRYKRIKPGILKGYWTKEQDEKLLECIKKYGINWKMIAKEMPNRSGKQIRDRYLNNLNPELNKNKFTPQEDKLLISLYNKYGPSWSRISKYLKGRSGDMIKNRFFSFIRKKIIPISTNMKFRKRILLNCVKEEINNNKNIKSKHKLENESPIDINNNIKTNQIKNKYENKIFFKNLNFNENLLNANESSKNIVNKGKNDEIFVKKISKLTTEKKIGKINPEKIENFIISYDDISNNIKHSNLISNECYIDLNFSMQNMNELYNNKINDNDLINLELNTEIGNYDFYNFTIKKDNESNHLFYKKENLINKTESRNIINKDNKDTKFEKLKDDLIKINVHNFEISKIDDSIKNSLRNQNNNNYVNYEKKSPKNYKINFKNDYEFFNPVKEKDFLSENTNMKIIEEKYFDSSSKFRNDIIKNGRKNLNKNMKRNLNHEVSFEINKNQSFFQKSRNRILNLNKAFIETTDNFIFKTLRKKKIRKLNKVKLDKKKVFFDKYNSNVDTKIKYNKLINNEKKVKKRLVSNSVSYKATLKNLKDPVEEGHKNKTNIISLLNQKYRRYSKFKQNKDISLSKNLKSEDYQPHVINENPFPTDFSKKFYKFKIYLLIRKNLF